VQDQVDAGYDGAVSVRRLPAAGHHDGHAGGRHRAAGATGSRRPAIIAGAVVVIAVACVVAWLWRSETGRPADRVDAAPDRPVPAAAKAWMRTELPTNSRLLTDGVAAPVGYPSSSLLDARNWHDFDYLLTTLTGSPSPDAAVAPIWPSSTPVAVFDGLQVRHIAEEAAGKPFNPADDLAQRQRAGAALLSNPRIDVSLDARQALEAGLLDMRVAAVLSGLASQIKFGLQDVTPVPAEAAAGTPVRSITIYPTDTGRAMRNVDAFDAALKPDRAVVGEYGSIAMHWPLSFSPIPSVT
jgi:hypothetical protein